MTDAERIRDLELKLAIISEAVCDPCVESITRALARVAPGFPASLAKYEEAVNAAHSLRPHGTGSEPVE
jgi:hypothetical protein